MEEIGKYPLIELLKIGDMRLTISTLDWQAITGTWIIMGFLILIGWLVARSWREKPGLAQMAAELVVGTFDDLVSESLELEDRKYLPLILTLFLYLVLANSFGIVPGQIEPSKNINTPLSLGPMGFVIAVYSAVRVKGLKNYLSEFCEPSLLMLPLNLIGEASKVVSISFRLFGNIMGGAIIIEVVSFLVWYLFLPIPLSAFFGLFVGTIQAFVFTMLTLTYIAVARKE